MIDIWDRHLYWEVVYWLVSLGLLMVYIHYVCETWDETRDVARRMLQRGRTVFFCTCLVMSADVVFLAWMLGWTFWVLLGLLTVYTGVMFQNHGMFHAHCDLVFLQMQLYVPPLKWFRKEPTGVVSWKVQQHISAERPWKAFRTNYTALVMSYAQIKKDWRNTQSHINAVQQGTRPPPLDENGERINLRDVEENMRVMLLTLYTFQFQICSVWPMRLLVLVVFLAVRSLLWIRQLQNEQAAAANVFDMAQVHRLLELHFM